jgi:UTP--glucose-1-phosphate uridylyltransferase
MARVCEETGGSVVGLKEVPREDVGAYGVIEPIGDPDENGVVAVRTLVEKPDPSVAPSNLIVIGRYVLTPDVFDLIGGLEPGAGGEIQLTDALRLQAARSPFHGVIGRVSRHDTGTPMGWLTAVIDVALADPSIGPGLRNWLRTAL